MAVFGEVFLRAFTAKFNFAENKVYLSVNKKNYKGQKIENSPKEKMSVGAIIFIVLGVLAILLLLGIVTCKLWGQRQKSRQSTGVLLYEANDNNEESDEINEDPADEAKPLNYT